MENRIQRELVTGKAARIQQVNLAQKTERQESSKGANRHHDHIQTEKDMKTLGSENMGKTFTITINTAICRWLGD